MRPVTRGADMRPMSAHYIIGDPTCPEERARIVAVVRESRDARTPDSELFAHEVAADERLNNVTRAEAEIILARWAHMDGGAAAAEKHDRRALHLAWGTGALPERIACINLLMICAMQFRVSEGLTLARRAWRLAEDDGDPNGRAMAALNLAGLLSEIGDEARFSRAATRVEREVPRLKGGYSRHIPPALLSLRLHMARLRNDVAECGRFLNRLEAMATDNDPRQLPEIRAAVLRADGRPERALRLVRAHVDPEKRHDEPGVRLEILAVRCLADLNRRDEAIAAGRAFIALLGGKAREEVSPGRRMAQAELIGQILESCGAEATDVRQAYDVAAAAALERSRELDRFLREFPALLEVHPDDLALLNGYRESFLVDRRKLAAAVAGLVESGDPAALPSNEQADDFLCLCAWCERVRGPEGVWIPLKDFHAPDGALQLTHAICGDCKAGATAR